MWNTLSVPLENGMQCTLIPGPQYYDLTAWGRGYRNMSAHQFYPNAGRDNSSASWYAPPLSEVDKSELWEKDRLRQLEDDRAAFARHFRPSWDLRSITGARALCDVQAFVRDSLNLEHWNLPTDNAAVKKLLIDAVASGQIVPVVNREYRGVPRVAQPTPGPLRWPTTRGGGYGYAPRILNASEFDALRRANGELPQLDVVNAMLDPRPALGAPATGDDGFGLLGVIESAAGALLGGGDDDPNANTKGNNGCTYDDELFGPASGDGSTPLANAQPFDYRIDRPYGDSFDIAKTPNDGEPGTWYTNPGSSQMRLFGDDGKPAVDLDFDHFHNGLKPHAHNWTGGARDGGDDVVPFSPWSP